MTFHRYDRLVLIALGLMLLGAVAYGLVFDRIALALGVGLPLMAVAFGVAMSSKGRTGSQVGLPIIGMALVSPRRNVISGSAPQRQPRSPA